MAGDDGAYQQYESSALRSGARSRGSSDQSQGHPEHTDGQIAEMLSISRRTVIRIKQRFVQENLEVALTGSFPRERPERRCLDGKGEAQLIHLACSQAPDGRHGFPLELLADKVVQLGYVEHISPETVRKTLKKTNSNPGACKSWCFPKQADGDFVYHMEDVLDVYCQPYDPSVPRICMDEMGKNLVKEKHPSEPAQPGQVAREDYTYEKQGSANLFIAYEPRASQTLSESHRTPHEAGLGAVHARGAGRALSRSEQGGRGAGQPQYAYACFVLRSFSSCPGAGAGQSLRNPLHAQACKLAQHCRD